MTSEGGGRLHKTTSALGSVVLAVLMILVLVNGTKQSAMLEELAKEMKIMPTATIEQPQTLMTSWTDTLGLYQEIKTARRKLVSGEDEAVGDWTARHDEAVTAWLALHPRAP